MRNVAYAVNCRERRSEVCDCVFTKNPKALVSLLRYETLKSSTDSAVIKIPCKSFLQNYREKLPAEA